MVRAHRPGQPRHPPRPQCQPCRPPGPSKARPPREAPHRPTAKLACPHGRYLNVNTIVRTAIPAPVCYPLSDSAFGFLHGMVKLFYGFSWGERASGVADLLRALAAPARRQKKSR